MAFKENFFYYPTYSEHDKKWGVVVTALGHTNVLPNSTYPPLLHPKSHQFSVQKSRHRNDQPARIKGPGDRVSGCLAISGQPDDSVAGRAGIQSMWESCRRRVLSIERKGEANKESANSF